MTNFLILNNEIAITDRYGTFIISSHALNKGLSFKDANKLANESGYKCPSRIECIRIWDAISEGLNKELIEIGGDPIEKFIWTSDKWKDPENKVDNIAWFFSAKDGSLYCDCENDTTPACRPIKI